MLGLTFEARIINVIEDSSLSDVTKTKKLNDLTGKMGQFSAEYGVDMKKLLLREVTTEALNRVLSDRPKRQ